MENLLKDTKNSDYINRMRAALTSLDQEKRRRIVDFPKAENWKDGAYNS